MQERLLLQAGLKVWIVLAWGYQWIKKRGGGKDFHGLEL